MDIHRSISVRERNPLETTRILLRQVWERAELEGLFAPIWQTEQQIPQPILLTDPSSIHQVDPFAPVMLTNTAGVAAAIISENPGKRYVFLFRPCELRSLKALATWQDLDLSHTLIFSIDCLAVFPMEDFLGRIGETEDGEQISLDLIQFASQGGILPSRYKRSCQLCERPYPKVADLGIELLGLQTTEHLVIGIRDQTLAERLGLDGKTTRDVPPEVRERRECVLERITSWRGRSLAYAQSHLDKTQSTFDGLTRHLNSCTLCFGRLKQHCPLFEHAWSVRNSGHMESRLRDWILTCGGCGMCEHQCPQNFPLFTVIAHLRHIMSG